MFSGKAISRAIRGHFLVDAVLNSLLVSHTFNLPLLPIGGAPADQLQNNQEEEPPVEAEELEGEVVREACPVDKELEQAGELYDKVINGKVEVNEACSADILKTLTEKLETKRRAFQNQRTAVLWLQYMEMVDILRRFIKAERTGNWDLHLQAVYDMLPFFAAAGHNLYAKSAHVYLQIMSELKDKHPDVFQSFQDGLHVVRRSDRYWAGLSTDLTIEQVLMRRRVVD